MKTKKMARTWACVFGRAPLQLPAAARGASGSNECSKHRHWAVLLRCDWLLDCCLHVISPVFFQQSVSVYCPYLNIQKQAN